MSEIDDILKKMKEGLGEMAEEAREKYNDLMEYLDNHSSEEIKSDLQKMASKAKEEAQEGVDKAKEQLGDIDIKEKLNDARESVEEGIGKAKEKMEQLRSDYEAGKYDEQIAEARKRLEEGVDNAKKFVDEGLDTVQKQWEELRKRLGL